MLGVIALAYSSFERGLVTIYAHHCAQQHMPYELVHLYYSSLNEKSQLKAIKTIFDAYEKEPARTGVRLVPDQLFQLVLRRSEHLAPLRALSHPFRR